MITSYYTSQILLYTAKPGAHLFHFSFCQHHRENGKAEWNFGRARELIQWLSILIFVCYHSPERPKLPLQVKVWTDIHTLAYTHACTLNTELTLLWRMKNNQISRSMNQPGIDQLQSLNNAGLINQRRSMTTTDKQQLKINDDKCQLPCSRAREDQAKNWTKILTHGIWHADQLRRTNKNSENLMKRRYDEKNSEN